VGELGIAVARWSIFGTSVMGVSIRYAGFKYQNTGNGSLGGMGEGAPRETRHGWPERGKQEKEG